MNSTKNSALTAIRIVVWVFLVAAAGISTTHIIESGMRLGLGWESYTLPMFVDGVAVVGKLSMLPRFSRAFRRSGFRLLMAGGTLSLAANIYAGHNLGQRAFGVVVVGGFMLLESHVTKAATVKVPVEPVNAPVSPGMPPVVAEPAEVLAFRAAQRELRKTSKLPALNAGE